MEEEYFKLKHKLEELGYNYKLPLDAVPLVECILADLLQTTRSLQHYMDLSKDVLNQRDSLMMAAEPYKCDNIRLIQENNQLHQDNILLKEENLKLNKEYKFKMKTLTTEMSEKESLISKLKHDIRDLSLRGLCADTLSSRNKSKKRDAGDNMSSKECICKEKKNECNNDLTDLNRNIQLQMQLEEYVDEIAILKDQIRHRDSEIVRLKILLEGGRPLQAISREYAETTSNSKMIKEIKELEIINDNLRKELEKSLEKQHEAMLRALTLADKNKSLQEEMEKVDRLALKVEAECNKKLQTMTNELKFLESKVINLSYKNSQLEHELLQKNLHNTVFSHNVDGTNVGPNEKQDFQKEISDLKDLNKCLQNKISTLSQVLSEFHLKFTCDNKCEKPSSCAFGIKDELQLILEDERKKYENCLTNLQEKLNETINHFSKYVKDKNTSFQTNESPENLFVRDLHVKLCEYEQKHIMLKKENDELKYKLKNQEHCDKKKYQDIISHLNLENTQLSKENIVLSQQISQYKALSVPTHDRGDNSKQDVQRLNNKIEVMSNDLQILQKDKSEYISRYKDAMDLVDKLKQDLLNKQKEIENLEEENCSYKISNRTERATAEHVKDECSMLRDQIQQLKNDIMREKTISNQIKNVQIESERSSTETQNELTKLQKKLSISHDTINNLEETCKKLQSEIVSLKNEKSHLMDNIKTIDKERDELVIDLDNKTENICMLKKKLKDQSYDIDKLNNDIAEFKRKLSMNRVSEHKIVDYESQIKFLNEEILRLTKQYDLAIMENKHLQNSLADANGMLKLTKIELEKARKDVESLKQQLQHYVDEIRRIEELLSEKEAERSDMLEHFASLSVEANILENTNHSLESESASKSLKLQTYVNKIQDLENKISDKDNMIDSQSARIAAMTCKVAALENDVKLLTEEKIILEQNISYLKQKCNNMQQNEMFSSKSINDHEIQLKTYENKIKSITHRKKSLEDENSELKIKLNTAEKLLSQTRREVIDLKLALQDATVETKSLQECINKSSKQGDSTIEHETAKEELEMREAFLVDHIDELSNEDIEQSDGLGTINYKYGHSSTI